MSTATDRFRRAAARLGIELDVVRYPEGTRTAEDAARAIGCTVGQIVDSLVFVAVAADGSEEPVLALTSGANRVDTDALARLHGARRVRKADADEVGAATGFAIGGTPPFGHPRVRVQGEGAGSGDGGVDRLDDGGVAADDLEHGPHRRGVA